MIKFRAFDDGKMIYEKDIPHIGTIDEHILRLAKFFCNIRPDSILMRFTGLHLNNVEIYEGDIIRYSMEDEGVEYGVVRFSADGYWTTQDEGTSEELLSEELASKCLVCEVVGNVYQNSEIINAN